MCVQSITVQQIYTKRTVFSELLLQFNKFLLAPIHKEQTEHEET